jgi:hypothetical protein
MYYQIIPFKSSCFQLTGFGYEFGSLSEDPNHKNELAEAFAAMFKVGSRISLVGLFRGLFPLLRVLVCVPEGGR